MKGPGAFLGFRALFAGARDVRGQSDPSAFPPRGNVRRFLYLSAVVFSFVSVPSRVSAQSEAAPPAPSAPSEAVPGPTNDAPPNAPAQAEPGPEGSPAPEAPV